MNPFEQDKAAAVVLQLLENGFMTRVEKPWGTEHIITTDVFLLKYIVVNAGHQTSLQHHEVKEEVQYVISVGPGGGGVYVEPLQGQRYWRYVGPGDHIRVLAGTIHQTVGPCTLIEVTTLHDEDVVRHNDMYGRDTSGSAVREIPIKGPPTGNIFHGREGDG